MHVHRKLHVYWDETKINHGRNLKVGKLLPARAFSSARQHFLKRPYIKFNMTKYLQNFLAIIVVTKIADTY